MPSKRAILSLSVAALIIVPILLSMSGGSSGTPQLPTSLPSQSQGSPLSNLQTYGTGLSGAPVILDEPTLSSMTGGSMTQSAFDLVIQEYFVPMGIHLVFLDIGWGNAANTTTSEVTGGYQSWVTNWLAASEQYGIYNIFFMRQFGYFFSSPSWDQTFLNAYPGASTVNASGVNVPISNCAGCTSSSGWTITSSFVYRQYEEDLKQLVAWYGNYSSWIGFGEGATGDRNYYGHSGSSLKTSRPWDNGTISLFANSVFFQRNINASGYYYGSNTLSKVWSMFLKDRPDIGASTGVPLVSSSNIEIFGGTGSGGKVEFQRFFVPWNETLDGFILKAYISSVGSPPNSLYETIYPDNASNAGSGKPILRPIQSVAVTGISTTPGWVSTSFTSTLTGGDYYWVAFTTNGGDGSNYYNVYTDLQNVYPDIFDYTSSSNGFNNMFPSFGGSVLWLQSSSGKDITVYPFLQAGPNQPGQTASFMVQSVVNANTVAFFVSDRAYDPNNVTITLEYPNGTVLSTGVFSEAYMSGASGLSYFPVQLSKTVTLYPGMKYQIVASALPPGDSYAGSSGVGVTQDYITESANPSSAGYLGQGTWPIFDVGLMNIQPNGISNMQYVGITDLFSSPGYVPGSEIAMRFEPTASGNLQEFEINTLSAPSGTSASLQAFLRGDNTTGGSHPGTANLAVASVSLSTINSALKSCPTGQSSIGTCTWANMTGFSGSSSLSAGSYYWLVLNVSQNDHVVFEREVGPYRNLVYYSTNDFHSSWGVPPDGPSDLSYQIVTSAQTISNTVIGESKTSSDTGQSFSSPNSFQLKGVWLYVSTGGDNNIQVSIEPDSGSDSPSGTVLASGVIPFNSPGDSLNYASLNFPVNITANTKYWIVTNSACEARIACSNGAFIYADWFRSDYSPLISSQYNGRTLHYEVNSGGSWTTPARGDEIFILAGSDSAINTYNTQTLYSEISTHDDNSTTGSAIAGWNDFLNYEQSLLMYNLSRFFTSYSGRQMVWYTGMQTDIIGSIPNFNSSYVYFGDSGSGGVIGCPPSHSSCGGDPTFWLDDANQKLQDILEAPNQLNWLPWSSFGSTADNRGDLTPIELRTEFLTGIPMMARNPVTFNDWAWGTQYHGLDNLTEEQYAIAFGNLLNRMEFNGGYYGTEKNAVRVLWIESSDNGFFPQFLTPALNITYVSSNSPGVNNLTNFGDFSQFNVIMGSPPSPTTSFLQREINFVKNGGGIVETSFGANSNSQDNLIGLETSSLSVSTTSALSIVTQNKITSPYTSLSYNPYWVRYQISALTNESAQVLVKDSNGNPVVVTNNYYSGRGVLIEQPSARLENSGNPINFDGCCQYGSPRDSYVSLLLNGIFYAAHHENMLPVLWESSYAVQNWSPYLQFSVDGSPGLPVLLWVSNNDSAPSNFDIHLNSTFYNISTQGWVAIDMQNMQVVAKGSGSDIHVSTTIPAYSWAPIYIMNDSSSNGVQPIYSTASIISSSSGSSASYTISGPSNASSWIVISSSQGPSSVSSSNFGALQQSSSLQSLNSSQIGYSCSSISAGGACSSWTLNNQEGWYFDSANGLIYVHFVGGALTLTLYGLSGAGSTSSTTSTAYTSSSSRSTSSSTSSSTTRSTTTTGVSTTSASKSSTSSTQTSSSIDTSVTSQSQTSSSLSQSPTSSSSSSLTSSSGLTSSPSQSASTSTNSPRTLSSTQGNSYSILSFMTSSPSGAGLMAYEIALISGMPVIIRIVRSSSERRSRNYGWRW